MKKITQLCIAILFVANAFAQINNPKSEIKNPKGFNQKSYNLLMSKRLKKSTKQRDSLYSMALYFDKDTTERGMRLRYLESMISDMTTQLAELEIKHKDLKIDYAEMNKRYTDLIKSSLSKTEQLNLALKQKEEILLAREKRLAELESLIRKQDSITKELNDIMKKALLSFTSDELTVEMKNGKVYVSLSDKLLFKSGSADVEEKGMEALKKLAEVLNKNTDVDVLIEGHTDNVPIKTAQFQDNWDLSTARATNIVRLLNETHKVNAKRLTAAGRGQFMPKGDNATADGRAKNRRTEIILSPKLDELFKLIKP